MNVLTAPEILYIKTSSLFEAIRIVAEELGDSASEADEVYSMLPAELKDAPSFFDFAGDWRYEFGEPFDIGGLILVGTYQFPKVQILYSSIKAAKELVIGSIDQIMHKLKVPGSHMAFLSELQPLMRLSVKDVQARYEVTGYGSGNRGIDWLFERVDGVSILLEVKCRKKDLLKHVELIPQHFSATIPIMSSGVMKRKGKTSQKSYMQVKPPVMDFESLFKDTAEKFAPRQVGEYLQGVWIDSQLKIEQVALDDYFAGIDPDKLHFVILGGWSEETYFLVRDNVNAGDLLSFFGLVQSRRFVF